MMDTRNLAWHYTTAFHIQAILESEMLRPTGIGIKPPEKPILWFSTNKYWENTVIKSLSDDEAQGFLSRDQLMFVTQAFFRFGVPMKGLLFGTMLKQKARMPNMAWRNLLAGAKVNKADFTEWCGTFESIALQNTVIEVMYDDMRWRPLINDFESEKGHVIPQLLAELDARQELARKVTEEISASGLSDPNLTNLVSPLRQKDLELATA